MTSSDAAAAVIWLTGLSSAGKSTLGEYVLNSLRISGRKAEMLDGDVVRLQLWKDLLFSKKDRDENVRRLTILGELLARNGIITIISAISPYRAAREEARKRLPTFMEVYVNAPLDVCERRDIKGLYRNARAGGIHGFTGVDAPYEAPLQPDVECRTDLESIEESGEKILRYLRTHWSL